MRTMNFKFVSNARLVECITAFSDKRRHLWSAMRTAVSFRKRLREMNSRRRPAYSRVIVYPDGHTRTETNAVFS